MYLFLSILLSAMLGYLLLMMGPIVGGILAFGIIAGGVFRGVYLLNDIRKRLAFISPEAQKVQEQVQEHIHEIIPDHLKSPGAYKKFLESKR